MSAIALSWVATIKVGNQTAKQLLQFYASHNFKKSGYEFKIETLSHQLEVSERSIQNAHKLLISKGFIVKKERFSKDGSQLPSNYDLNIPDEFVDNFFREGEINAPSPRTTCTPRGAPRAPLSINNKNNNKEREPARKKREPLSDDFIFDEENQKLCKERKLVEKDVLEKFKAWAKLKRHLSDDWQLAAKLWIMREKPKQTVSAHIPTKESATHCTIKDFVPNEPIKIASSTTVDKHMEAINRLLSRKMTNGRSTTSKEERQK